MRAGVPQGTKLSPILFVMVTNDLKLASPRCSYWKYVDDITISEFAAARGVSILQSGVEWGGVEWSRVQYSAVQCSVVQCSAVQCSAVQYSTVQCSAVQCSAAQWGSVE